MRLVKAYTKFNQDTEEYETYGDGTRNIDSGRACLLIRDRGLYQPILDVARKSIENEFSCVPDFNLDNAEILEIDNMRMSRLQGILFNSKNGIYYLDIGRNKPMYLQGESNISLQKHYDINTRIGRSEIAKLGDKWDTLRYNLGDKNELEISIIE